LNPLDQRQRPIHPSAVAAVREQLVAVIALTGRNGQRRKRRFHVAQIASFFASLRVFDG
jgi:hypothetical protein